MRGIGKLRSRSGATMVLALLVFMLCIFVGTAALTAAAANSGRYTHLKEEEQAYLNVSSAAKLFRDEFVDSQYMAMVTVVESTAAGVDPTYSATGGTMSPTTGTTTQIPSKFMAYLNWFLEVKAGSEKDIASVSVPSGFTVTYGGSDVKVECEATKNDLTLTFSQGDSFKTVLKLVGTVSYSVPTVTSGTSSTGDSITTTTKTATISWTEENAHISEAKD